MGRSYTLKHQVLLVFIGKACAYAMHIVLPIILVRLFSRAEFGVYRQSLMIVSFLVPILGLQLYRSLFYFYPLAESKAARDGLMSQSFFLVLGLALVFLLASLLCRPHILNVLHERGLVGATELYLWIVLLVFFSVVALGLQRLFIVEGKPHLSMRFDIAGQLIRVCLLLTAVLAFGTVKAAIISLTLLMIVHAVFLYAYLRFRYHIAISKIALASVTRQLNYASPLAFGQLLNTIGSYADKLILTAMFTAEEFAIYSAGHFKVPMLTIFYASVGDVILRRISEYSAQTTNSRQSLALWRNLVVKNATVTIPAIVFFIFLARPLITLLFTEQYVTATNVFRLTLLAPAIQMLGYGYIIRGYARTRVILAANLARMVVSVTLGLFLIASFGVVGAALTFLAGFATNAAIQLACSRQLLDVPWSDFLPWRDLGVISFFCLVPGLGVYLLTFVGMSNVLIISVGILAYFPAVYSLLMMRGYLPKPSPAHIKKFFGMP